MDENELIAEAQDLIKHGRLGSGQKSIIRDLITALETRSGQLAKIEDWCDDAGYDIRAILDVEAFNSARVN